jgi:hypothetical protein
MENDQATTAPIPIPKKRKPAPAFVQSGQERLKQITLRIKEKQASGMSYKEARASAWSDYRQSKTANHQ